MKKAKHTPGPWTAHPREDVPIDLFTPEWYCIDGPGSDKNAMGKKNGVALADERDLALGFLVGLHPCITIDGPPMSVAERIFDAVIADRAGLKAQLKQAQHTVELLQSHISQLRRSQHATTISKQYLPALDR